jgi:ABC-type sugar transport system substrate-binding protein
MIFVSGLKREAKSLRSMLFRDGMQARFAMAADIVGLITKSNSSPFFIKMKEGAAAKAQARK